MLRAAYLAFFLPAANLREPQPPTDYYCRSKNVNKEGIMRSELLAPDFWVAWSLET